MSATSHKRVLKVLFLARPDLDSRPGGDTAQINSTISSLNKLGIEVELGFSVPGEADSIGQAFKRFDLLHAFNLSLAHQLSPYLKIARDAGLPVILSPIFWDSTEYEERGMGIPFWKRAAASVLTALKPAPAQHFLRGRLRYLRYNSIYRASLRETLESAHMLLPNSDIEAALLRSKFACTKPSRKVVNGCRVGPEETKRPAGAPDNYILCVARIERRKNQERLIEAMQGMDSALVLAGSVNPAEADYRLVCLRAARKFGTRVVFAGECDWDRLWSLYKFARAHVQPSWYETPGLSSLEAAAAGCPVVCTAVGSAREYFGDLAEYCRPEDVDSIRRALTRVLQTPPPRDELRDFTIRHYNWDRAAEETAAAYMEVLTRNHERELPDAALAR